MTTVQPDLTVGAIAAGHPAATRVFEQLGIDYCCGGGVALADACSAKGLDCNTVINQIAAEPAAGDSVDWQTAPLTRLTAHIVNTHHAYLRTNLPRIEALMAKVRAAHAAKHGKMLSEAGSVFAGMQEELTSHLLKEERILFPLIESLEAGTGESFHCGSVKNPIRVMLMEHDSAGDALTQLRAITGDYNPPADACNTFKALYFELSELEKDLHQHIHLENNILFPRAIELE